MRPGRKAFETPLPPSPAPPPPTEMPSGVKARLIVNGALGVAFLLWIPPDLQPISLTHVSSM